MYGYFSDVKKRDRANEAHKKSIRDKVKKSRESYIGYKTNTELDLPKLTEDELIIFKKKLKSEKKNKNYKICHSITIHNHFSINSNKLFIKIN
jgi:hypothetical protein